VAQPEGTPVLDAALAAFVHSGVAVVVATRDESLAPRVTRGWGPEVSSNGHSLTLCVDARPGADTRANLEGNGSVAVAFSPPTIARALQVKGAVTRLGEPDEMELERVERHLEAFCAEVERIGIAAALARRMFSGSDLVSVTLSVGEVFDQTPGPTAGKRL
jgi:flavin reductase (DIM6/NTAB) family NADH-FMN oxidoreductase RutF